MRGGGTVAKVGLVVGDLQPYSGTARRVGAVCQGLILGVLVSVALINLLKVANDVQIFRYQGF
jgi:hypothetical protein